MKRFALAVAGAVCALASLAPIATRAQDAGGSPPPPEPTIKARDVKPGAKGYGLTVISGEKPEKFEVEAISVVENQFYKEDIILIRFTQERFQHLGVLHGMSGSPIYFLVDGKPRLAGALGYGFSPFPKDAIAGVTPIDDMLRMCRAPERPREGSPRTVEGLPRTGEGSPRTVDLRRALAELRRPWTSREAEEALPASPETAADASEPRLVRLGLPVVYSGGSPGLGERLRGLFARRREPFHPVPAGGEGAGSAPQNPEQLAALEPGSAVGIQLVRGDLSMAAVGTLTAIDGEKLTGFGHPFEGDFGAGPLELPVCAATVKCCFADLNYAFKLATPTAPAGTLVSDEQFGFVARRKPYPASGWIPVDLTVHDGSGPARTFHSEVVRDRRFLSLIDSAVVADGVSAGAARSEDCSTEVKLKVSFATPGLEPLEVSYVEQHAGAAYGVGEPLGRIVELLDRNPIAPVSLASVSVDVRVKVGREGSDIEACWADDAPVRPGQKVKVHVRTRPYRAAPVTKVYEVEVPRGLEDGDAVLEVVAGDEAPQDLPVPEKLADLVSQIKTRFELGARDLVFSWVVPGDEVQFRGRALPDLPPSAERLLLGQGRGDRVAKTVHRVHTHEAVATLLAGQASCHVTVERGAGPKKHGR